MTYKIDYEYRASQKRAIIIISRTLDNERVQFVRASEESISGSPNYRGTLCKGVYRLGEFCRATDKCQWWSDEGGVIQGYNPLYGLNSFNAQYGIIFALRQSIMKPYPTLFEHRFCNRIMKFDNTTTMKCVVTELDDKLKDTIDNIFSSMGLSNQRASTSTIPPQSFFASKDKEISIEKPQELTKSSDRKVIYFDV